MGKPKDFSDDLAVLDSSVRGEVDTILKLVREKEGKHERRPEEALPANSVATADSTEPDQSARLLPDREENVSRKTRRTATRSAPSSGTAEQVVLENVTTRLSRQTNELLTEAALRQKLKKETPSTRQDIVEAALQEWFRKHGYRLQTSENV
jgi:hypothetical protein